MIDKEIRRVTVIQKINRWDLNNFLSLTSELALVKITTLEEANQVFKGVYSQVNN